MPSQLGYYVDMQLQLKMNPDGTLQKIQLSIRDDNGYTHVDVENVNYAQDHNNSIHAISYSLPKKYVGFELKESDGNS